MEYFDVWQRQDEETVTPVQVDIQAESAEQACEIIAQETGIDISLLIGYEASNPGYREA